MRLACLMLLFAGASLLMLGCGSAAEYSRMAEVKSEAGYGSKNESFDTAARAIDGTPATLPVSERETGEPGEPAGNREPPAEPIQRQIIYTGRVSLVVEEFEGIPEKVEQLAVAHGGFIASSNLHGSAGSPRSGTWTIRVPARQYGTFLEAAKSLGEFQSSSTESQEVTAEFYDVKARIANKQRQEARLVKLLEESTGKLEDVLNVERELARVREEIERMQGRLRVLTDLTSFSTITLTIQEIRGYKPPEAPTFSNRIARAWTTSLEALVTAGENLAIAAVAAAPWLAVLAVLLAIFVGVIRLLYFRRSRAG